MLLRIGEHSAQLVIAMTSRTVRQIDSGEIGEDLRLAHSRVALVQHFQPLRQHGSNYSRRFSDVYPPTNRCAG